MKITLQDIEKNIKPLGGKVAYDREIIFDLLAAYGRSRGNITRLRKGQLNVADDKENEVAQKGIVYFKPVGCSDDQLYLEIDDLKTSPTVVRYSTRFVIVTNFQKLLAIDIKTGEPLDIKIDEIDKYFTFFLPWAGMEKSQFVAENHADVKAAVKMAKLFDILISYNGYKTAKEWHHLTTFFTRILFCFFAEDTNVFEKSQFVNSLASFTQDDGSDLKDFFARLFESLDKEDKSSYPAYLQAFPYVNGRLFRDKTDIPNFNREARRLLIESSSKLDWSDINPDIFGSMFQAVIRPGKRAGLGQHYTNVPNIMKTIEPLFLDEIKDEFDKYYNNTKKLKQLLTRISKIKIFDPACGSGNFLVIAYKELRKLEHAILERQGELAGGNTQQILIGSHINIENFYGIEIDDFAHEVAILSLWIAKHQMNMEFAEKFGVELPLIPLKEAGNIKKGNATRLKWEEVCPRGEIDEVYLISNPPYHGSKRQNKSQKEDLEYNFKPITTKYKDLDYIAIWFYKGARYISGTKSKLSFVSTNSISQGTQVELLWPIIYELNNGIAYAYISFKWSNNAKGQAGVTCIIISLADKHNLPKDLYIFDGDLSRKVTHINAYLTDGSGLIIGRRSKPLSSIFPKMQLGNMAVDNGNFFFTPEEKNKLVDNYPILAQYIRRVYGSYEYLNSVERFCLWVESDAIEIASEIPEIRDIAEKVRKFRSESKDASTRKMADNPYQFREMHVAKRHTIILPRVSSERRIYIPFGFLGSENILTDLAQAIYDADPDILGIISSRMHMAWMRAVAGRLETRIRYSSSIVYNNFPVPPLTESQRTIIKERAFGILDARENHTDKTLASMYNPEKMPVDLLKAHQQLDEVVDKVYRKRPFDNDEQRLAHLFELYETMANKEEAP